MGILIAILVALVAALILSLLSLLWRTSRHQLTYRRARALWRPFAFGDVKIIVGDLTQEYTELKEFEAGGLVGTGDVQAAANLVAYFEKVGFLGFNRSADVVYGNRLPGEIYGRNLICIGGQDANEATKEMFARIDHTLEGDAYEIRDATGSGPYELVREQPDSQGVSAVTFDYGVLIKTRNPEDAARQVLIIAGCSGYGTWAGAKLACSEEFIRDPRVSPGRPIECLYSVDVINGVPQKPQLLDVRPLLPTARGYPRGEHQSDGIHDVPSPSSSPGPAPRLDPQSGCAGQALGAPGRRMGFP